MMKPRIFVSHVNGDPSGEAFWPELSKKLKEHGFDVLVDRETLKPGKRWRSEIYSWIGLCDAAIVLISRQAIADTNKHWVARETACLLCRRAVDPALRVIPVLLDEISFAELEQSERFRDLELRETLCVMGNDANAVVDGLGEATKAVGAPLSLLALQLKAELQEMSPAQVEAALALCPVELGNWRSSEDPHRALALSLLTLDVDGLPEVLGYLATTAPAQIPRLRRMGRLLLANWVEIEAARSLAEEGVKKSDDGARRALVLNAPDELLAKLYALRAFPRIDPGWKFLPVTGVLGAVSEEQAELQLAQEIDEVITKNVRVQSAARERDPDMRRRLDLASRMSVCRRLADTRQPVFITLDLPPRAERIVVNLSRRYPFATFLLRTDFNPHNTAGLPGEHFRRLHPPVTPANYEELTTLRNALDDRLQDSTEDWL